MKRCRVLGAACRAAPLHMSHPLLSVEYLTTVFDRPDGPVPAVDVEVSRLVKHSVRDAGLFRAGTRVPAVDDISFSIDEGETSSSASRAAGYEGDTVALTPIQAARLTSFSTCPSRMWIAR